MRVQFKVVLFTILGSFLLFSEQASALSYFRVLVEGVESNLQTQGQMQTLEMDTDSGEVQLYYYVDEDSSRDINSGDYVIFMLNFVDNSEDFIPDTDPSEGTMSFPWGFNVPPGLYVIQAAEGESSIEIPFTVLAPDPLERSLSGTIVLEEVTPPDTRLANIPVLGGTFFTTMMVMFALTDDYGDFYFNWPGADDTLTIMVMGHIGGYEFEPAYSVFVDGHVTGYEITPRIAGMTEFLIFVEGVESYIQRQGEELVFDFNCQNYAEVEIIPYIDLDSNGTIDEGDLALFSEPLVFQDNNTYHIYPDLDTTAGRINVHIPFHFPPFHYLIQARDSYHSIYTHLRVLPPDPLLRSISGRVILESLTPPNPLLGTIVLKAEPEGSGDTFLGLCTPMGDYTINWGAAITDVEISFLAPYISEIYDFASIRRHIYADGFVTGIDLFVPLVAFEDSILINFSCDPDNYEVYPSNIQADYIDPLSLEVITSTILSDELPVYIPVRASSCGLLFRVIDPFFAEHVFVSPSIRDTIWISPSDYPESIDIYADPTNYHFMMILEGFDLDSVPTEGITVELTGTDGEGHQYYTPHTFFIDYYAEEYVVGGEHELCNGEWTVTIPELIEPGYLPAVTESSFSITETTDWPWFTMRIPVTHTAIDENLLPLTLDVSLYPNPFNSSVSIDFYNESQGLVTIDVFDLTGHKVATILKKNLPSGNHHLHWDGPNPENLEAASGVFFFKFTNDQNQKIMKGIYLR